jgi:murein DD-endopeptidase MepM/ murein hydrolase activator NlpD
MDKNIVKYLKTTLSENPQKTASSKIGPKLEANSALTSIEGKLLPVTEINKAVLQPFPFKVSREVLLSNHEVLLSKVKFKPLPVIPIIKVEPTEILENPILAGDYLFYPDETSKTLYYISSQPFLTDFSITIDKQESGGTTRITGAKAAISISLYAEDDLKQVQETMNRYTLLHPYKNWIIRQLNVLDLKPDLLLDRRSINHVDSSASSDNGSATFLIDLNETGAQDFLNALQTGRPDTLRGSCRIEGRTYVKKNKTYNFKPINLQVELGHLLSQVTMDSVRIVNAQTTLQSTIVVTGNPNIEDVTLSLKTNNLVVEQFVFGKEGGRAQLSVTDLNFNDLQIELIVLVNYLNPIWPIIENRKQLSYRESNWADIIDPATWLRNYRVITFIYDQNGNILESADSLSERATIEFVYKASYLQNATHEIKTVIETSSHSIEDIAVPIPNDATPGTLQLRVFAQRTTPNGQIINLKNKDLDFNATLIVVKVLADGTIEFLSNTDPESESGKRNEGLVLLETITRRKSGGWNAFASSPKNYVSVEEQDELDEEELFSLSSESNSPAMAVPLTDPVPFAPIPNTELFWPIESSHPEGRLVSYQAEDGRFIGNRSRRFLADRSEGTRYHVGLDLYGLPGDPVVAIEDGIITNFYHFYSDTYALLVEHSEFTVNYGEVHEDSLRSNGLSVGDRVSAGQVIGSVGRLRSGNSMCHFETYVLGTRTNARWLQSQRRPEELLNPTAFLLHLQKSGLSRDSSDLVDNSDGPNSGINISQAISKNRDFGRRLGWERRKDEIDLHLGFVFMTPSESAFAEAVADWQRNKGFSLRDIDGILGPNTWREMQLEMGEISESSRKRNKFHSSWK